MYLKHFDLDKNPFQLTPDTGFLYLSFAHARAKAHMSYTVWKWDGFAVLTGETGSGKTTLIRQLLTRIDNNIAVTMIQQTQMNEIEFLRFLLANFGVNAFSAEKAELIAQLNSYLIQQKSRGRRVLLVIDEAHHLSPRILEELRLLCGIRVKGKQVLNLILAGHTTLLKTLRSPAMEQLNQRVRLWFDLKGLSKIETKEYIQYRLATAGSRSGEVFTDTSIGLIHSLSGGIPRMINIICEAAMVAAYVNHERYVTAQDIKTAIKELQWPLYTGRPVIEKLNKACLKTQIGAQKNTATIIQGNKHTNQPGTGFSNKPETGNGNRGRGTSALDFA